MVSEEAGNTVINFDFGKLKESKSPPKAEPIDFGVPQVNTSPVKQLDAPMTDAGQFSFFEPKNTQA